MKKGFTLIELLIVIAIIGILAVALLPSILNAPASARDAAKQAALGQVAVALEQYNASAGSYPETDAGTGECMEPAGAGKAQSALKPYFKNNDIPKIDVTKDPTPAASTGFMDSCTGVVYCKLAGNRYFLGVALESPEVVGKGHYYGTTAFDKCNGGVSGYQDPSVLKTGAGTDAVATNVYGILN